jgi:hypothetical protein
MRIWKYPLPMMTGPDYEIQMPAGAQILAVQAQYDVPTIWALVDPSQPPQNRRFSVVGTGHPFEWDGVTGHHIGTFQVAHGSFVGHLFELPLIDGPLRCENCGKTLVEHDAMAHCWPEQSDGLVPPSS